MTSVRKTPATGVAAFGALLALGVALLPADAAAQAGGVEPQNTEPLWEWDPSDPRIGLSPGLHDAGSAAWNIELVANSPRPEGFATNSDLAFSGNRVFVGNYNGFNVYDVSDPANPRLELSVLCPGNQGDVSVFGNLLFVSVQAASGRLDCGPQGVEEAVSPERFRGVRIFDMTNLQDLQQLAAVQTCRGSHTHSLVTRPGDTENVYVYVSGTSSPRPGEELPGCSDADPEEDPNTSLFRIEVIQVPLANPSQARIVNEPRVFADPVTGDIAGLWSGGDHGPGTQRSSRTAACHDITTYPEAGFAGGACSGNGILFDITDPVQPTRIDEVVDSNFAYWHSATFNNDGTSVIFTDEWGGGSAPRCRDIDPPTWGANALFRIVKGELRLQGYYKLPVPQTQAENCVAHNGSLVPVPGRDIKVQAWYQGGVSVFDFTDPANPYEIAFFDRGPIDPTGGDGGGQWSTYWYNGYLYGAEMARGLDVFRLLPNEHLTQNEIDAANLVELREFNPQHQPRFEWPAEFVVARAYIDQLVRDEDIDAAAAQRIRGELDRAESASGGARAQAFQPLLQTAAQLEAEALSAVAAGRTGDYSRRRVLLAGVIRELAGQ